MMIIKSLVFFMVLGVTQGGGLVVVYVDLSWQPLGPLSPGKPVRIDVK